MALSVSIVSPSVDDTVVVLRGELDVYTVDAFHRKAGSVPVNGTLTVDLSEVELVDSSGLAALIRLAGGRTPTLVCPDPAIRRLFTVTGLERCFLIIADREDHRPTVT
ncbi:MAG: STAS domain-containing protein [Actinobacteria bacterium]|nr:STAS domain-containing protein [Actinomycetota bacterium]